MRGEGTRLADVDGAAQLPARVRQARPVADLLDHLGQGGAAEERHAHRLERPDAVERVDRDDIGVLELGQGLGLAEDVAGDLQRHRPAAEVRLPGEVDPAERPAAQLLLQPEAEENISRFGEGLRGLHPAGQRPRVRRVGRPHLGGDGHPLGARRRGVGERLDQYRRGGGIHGRHDRDGRPVRGVQTVGLTVLRGRCRVAVQPALAVLLEGDARERFGCLEHRREPVAILGQPPGSAVGPGVLQIDADQLGEDRDAQRVVGGGKELVRVGVRVAGQGVLERLDEVGQLGGARR